MSALDLVVTLDNDKLHYIPGDVVRGTVIRHSMSLEPKASLFLTFIGYTIVSCDSCERLSSKSILFQDSKQWPCNESGSVKGTQSWRFEFKFPALSEPLPWHTPEPICCSTQDLNTPFLGRGSRVHLPPSEDGEFWSAGGDHVRYFVGYGLQALLSGPKRFATVKASRRIFLNSALESPGWTTNITVPQLRSSFAKRIYHKGLQHRTGTIKTCPRIALHRDSFAVVNGPLHIRFALIEDDKDTEDPAPLKSAKVLLRKTRIAITQTKEARGQYPGSIYNQHSPDSRSSVKKWILNNSFSKDVALSRQPTELATLLGNDLICYDMVATVHTRNITVRHTISISTEVSYHGRNYGITLEQSLKVVPSPLKRTQLPMLSSHESAKIASSGFTGPRQDSLAPSLVPGRQFPNLPKCDIPKCLVNGGKPPSAVEELDEDGVIRRDWQNLHELKVQLEAVRPSIGAAKARALDVSVSQSSSNHEKADTPVEAATGLGSCWEPDMDDQVNEAVEICRRRSSVIL